MWYDNPFHWFTGWAEVSVTNGYPSQLDKRFGVECPVWLVTSQSPASVSATGKSYRPGVLKEYFETLMPILVDEVRIVTRGAEIAKQMKKEAASKSVRVTCAADEEGALEEKSYAVNEAYFGGEAGADDEEASHDGTEV
eukprot:scaffold7052_cov254-Pinguiococcus_pyrenoidosus.AAC.76